MFPVGARWKVRGNTALPKVQIDKKRGVMQEE